VDNSTIGHVVAIMRYPVKSMIGEELNDAKVTERGLLGDRAYALIDTETGKVVSAKNPRRWPNLFEMRAAYCEPSRDLGSFPPVQLTLPGGEQLSTEQADLEPRLSAFVGRAVQLARQAAGRAKAEAYWPDYEWLGQRNEVVDFRLAPDTFFDGATLHIVTTATLHRLRDLSPPSEFAAARFRPNFVIHCDDGSTGFPEENWIGQIITMGDVRLQIDRPSPRCVMTTLAQGNLPKDIEVLRAAVQHNRGNVGVYASVVRGGHVHRGASVQLN
jgi:uncharacterized protein